MTTRTRRSSTRVLRTLALGALLLAPVGAAVHAADPFDVADVPGVQDVRPSGR